MRSAPVVSPVRLVLTVDGRPLDVPVEWARTRRARRRGLLRRDDLDGVLVLERCRQVHTIGMRFAIDVAFCAQDGRVLGTATVPPGRISRWWAGAAFVLEARGGRFATWGVRRGSAVLVREHAEDES